MRSPNSSPYIFCKPFSSIPISPHNSCSSTKPAGLNTLRLARELKSSFIETPTFIILASARKSATESGIPVLLSLNRYATLSVDNCNRAILCPCPRVNDGLVSVSNPTTLSFLSISMAWSAFSTVSISSIMPLNTTLGLSAISAFSILLGSSTICSNYSKPGSNSDS